jgi:hypothetical protein
VILVFSFSTQAYSAVLKPLFAAFSPALCLLTLQPCFYWCSAGEQAANEYSGKNGRGATDGNMGIAYVEKCDVAGGILGAGGSEILFPIVL